MDVLAAFFSREEEKPKFAFRGKEEAPAAHLTCTGQGLYEYGVCIFLTLPLSGRQAAWSRVTDGLW